MRVLLADDHPLVLRGMRALLESQRDIVVAAEAADGLEAVRLCQEERPELAIVDLAMPKMNGIEVTLRFQKLPSPPRVIVLSMHGDESYVLRALDAGAQAYLL